MKPAFALVWAALVLAVAVPASDTSWNGEVRISNGTLVLRVAPVVGRVTHLGRVDGPNLLRQDPAMVGVTRPPTGRWDWNNPGGDWLWPVAQARWESLGVQRSWPPPALLEHTPWSATLRTRADGAPEIHMVQELGAPLHVRLTRTLWFCPERPGSLLVEQTATRTAASDIPVCLWQIAQIPGATRATLGVPEDTRHPEGWRHILGTVPPPESLRREPGRLEVDTVVARGAKIGTDGGEISGTSPAGTLRIRIEESVGEGQLPDGGCSLTLAIVTPGTYAEIETQGVEKNLPVGESLRSRLRYSLE